MSLADYSNKGVRLSEAHAYLTKQVQHDTLITIVSASLRKSTNPDREGNDVIVVEMTMENPADEQAVNSLGIVTYFDDLSAGKGMVRERKVAEACELAAAITGEPLESLLADPAQLYDLLSDSGAYEGKQLHLTSKPPKTTKKGNTFYNFQWNQVGDAGFAGAAPARKAKVTRPRNPAAEADAL